MIRMMLKLLPTLALATLATVAILAPADRAHAQFGLSTHQPVVGDPVLVAIPASADTLLVTYRPGSRIPTTQAIPTGGAGSVRWVPTRPGLVHLSVPGGGPGHYVSVRFRSRPTAGLAVLILAGSILFGGAGFAVRELLRTGGRV